MSTYGDPLTFSDFTDKQLCWLIEQAWQEAVEKRDTEVSGQIKTALAEFRRSGGVANKLEAMQQDSIERLLLDDWLHRALFYSTDLARDIERKASKNEVVALAAPPLTLSRRLHFWKRRAFAINTSR